MGSQRSLTNFNLITHGFGSPTVLGVLNIVQRVLSEAIRSLEKDFGLPQVAGHHQRIQVGGGVPASTGRYLGNGLSTQANDPYIHVQNMFEKRE